MEQTPAPPHIKGESFLQAVYRCKNKDNWFINTLYAYMNVIYQKRGGMRFRMSGTVCSSCPMMSTFWRSNVDGNVGSSRIAQDDHTVSR